MQVPKRKPGKYAGIKPDPFITREKYRGLESELGKLKDASRPRAIAEVKRLAADGDFSENVAYSMAKGRLRGINDRMTAIADQLKRAVIIEGGNAMGVAAIGSLVTVEMGGKTKAYRILGSTETDPAAGVISHRSPLGAALTGRRAGDGVRVRLKDREVEYKIIKVE